jgi:enterobacterial common antigen flippase
MGLKDLLLRARHRLAGKGLQDFVITLGSNGAISVFGAIAGILVARLLGPESRGELAAAIVWAGILGVLGQIGMPQAITYVTARDFRQLGNIFKATLFILAVQSTLIIVIGWLIAGFVLKQRQPGALDAVRIYLFSVPFATLITYLSTMAQGLRHFRFFSAFRIAGSITYIAVVAAAYVLDVTEVRSIVVWLLTGQIIVALVVLSVFYYHYRGVIVSASLHRVEVRQLIGYGVRTYGGSLSWIANARLDQFIMSFRVSLLELGIYAVAVSYAGLLFPLFGAFAMVLFPNVAAEERDAAAPIINRTLRLYLISSTIGCFVLALLSPLLIPWLFGPEFAVAIFPSRILLAGTIFLGGNYVLSDALRGLGHPTITSIAEIVGLIVTITCLLLLLPRFGIDGAAVASVISYASAFLILFIAVRYDSFFIKDVQGKYKER